LKAIAGTLISSIACGFLNVQVRVYDQPENPQFLGLAPCSSAVRPRRRNHRVAELFAAARIDAWRIEQIEGTAFGEITVDGKTYDHDVVIRLSGEIVERKKKLSKQLYGPSRVLSRDEAKFLLEKGKSSSAPVNSAMCTSHRKPRPILRNMVARYC
jgi:hypothetical protein